MGGRRRFKDAKASGRLWEGNSRTGLRGRPVGVARRDFKALPAARRQHGRPPSGIRGALLAWLGGTSRLCRRQGANMDGRRAEFGAPCWRGSAVLQGFAGGKAPTWAAAGRNSGRPVGVVRRCFKALPAARRQHRRPPSGIRGALLAWPGGGLRLCRRQGANMDGRRAEFEAPCWRGSAVLQGFAGGKAPTWTATERNSGRPVGVARRWIKACRRQGANMGGRQAEFGAACWRGPAVD